MPDTAIAYARPLSNENAKESVARQLQAMRDHAKANDVEIVKEFAEEVTARGDRIRFAEMIGQLQRGEIKADYIYVASLDRLGQDTGQLFGLFKKTLKPLRMTVISAAPKEDFQEYLSAKLAPILSGLMKQNAKEDQKN
jgi:DNA invertase Pin-like site-specific DNA recombinase